MTYTTGSHIPPALQLIAGIAVVSTLRILAGCIYDLFFHPLRNLPGPSLAKVSRLWARIGNFYGCKSQRIHAAHEKYGPIVRVGPDELSFANPAAVHEIYNNNDVFVKEESFYRAKRVFHEDHMMCHRDVEAHKQRRKLLSRGFSQTSMLDFESTMSEKIQTMLDQWARAAKDPVDVYPWVHWLGFDIVYHLMFDEDPGSVKAGQPHEVMPYLRAWKPTFIYKEFMPSLEKYGPFVPGKVGGYFRDVQAWKTYSVNIVRRCRKQGAKTPFLRSVLNDEKDMFLGRPLNDSELAEECMAGMFGGSGTTANTFVYTLWACLQRPDIVKNIQEELQENYSGMQSIPDYKDCSSLPYLQAVIKETMRLYPTIIATLPRTARRSTSLQGVHIPKGTIVGTQNYTIHRDPTAFPDADVFRPERWLELDGEQERKDAWTPFSVGSRKCVGINLAQMELSKLVAAFFIRFDGEINAETTQEDMQMYDNFSAAPVGAKLLLNLRER